MADDTERQKQYDYKANSNLVLDAGRRSRGRNAEPTGEVESLRNRMGGTRMGDRVKTTRPPELEALLEKKRKREAAKEKTNLDFKKGQLSLKKSDILAETEEVDIGIYRPKTRETTNAYEKLLSFLQKVIGDQPNNVIAGAADEALSIMKDSEMPGQEKLKECKSLLGRKFGDNDFNTLMEITNLITDFSPEAEKSKNGQVGDADDGDEDHDVNEEVGVAVVFDDEDEDDNDDNLDINNMEDEILSEQEEESNDEGDSEAQKYETTESKRQKTGVVQSKKGSAGEDSDQSRSKDGISAADVGAYWLQGKLKSFYNDANEAQKLAVETLEILANKDERVCENKLVLLLGFDKFDLIKILLKNRGKIYYCTRLKQAQTAEEKTLIEKEMSREGMEWILEELSTTRGASSWEADRVSNLQKRTQMEARALNGLRENNADHGSRKIERTNADSAGGVRDLNIADIKLTHGKPGSELNVKAKKEIDLAGLEFVKGDHQMSNKEVKLPPDSWRKKLKAYEEVHVPPLKPKQFQEGEKLVPIKSIPKFAHKAFKGMQSLNRIQSRIYPTALWHGEHKGEDAPNLLVCAPTGAGKTNVAVLTIMHEIGKFVKKGTEDVIDTAAMQKNLKIIYVAPMKALVQEVVSNFTKRLSDAYGVKVRELSGDQSLSKAEITDTQIIVTTPEKWDIVTRKSGERAYTQLVKLLIIDEIHLLHNERGAVLEGIVARTLRQQEQTQERIRIVGVSATLPNFQDVAKFLRVPVDKGLFFFDNSFRPVPLQQQYIGLTEKKAMKRFQLMNEICYEKISSSFKRNINDQILVFVHTRNETQKTAEAIKELAAENDELHLLVDDDNLEAKEILQSEAETSVKHPGLKEILPFGIGIHHAGMTRHDRNLVEDLFMNKYIKILVSTATLAWGVNLPAHSVIIKGTQVYNPEKGRWVELSQLDILQMLGRAGRPQYDTEGEGVIITTHQELKYYLSLLNEQLPIESQLIKKLPDMLNAEIVMGTITNLEDAVTWLGYTYLYVRMKENPRLYGIPVDEQDSDPKLFQRRADMIHSAAVMLDKAQLVRYDRRTGGFQVTPLGRIASHYYVTYDSMHVFNEYLKPTMGDIEVFRMFSLSKEFKNIVVRQEEKQELAKLVERAPIPIKESVEEPTAKVNVLLQAYISKMSLDGYAIACDLVYVHQSAGRIVRALFEICLSHGWSSLAMKCLDLANMVEHQVWSCQHFLRQLLPNHKNKVKRELPAGMQNIDVKLIQRLERNTLTPEQYFVLSPQELGELCHGGIKQGRSLHRLIHAFPRVEVTAKYQPITPSTLSMEVTIVPNFEFISSLLGGPQTFWIIVEDCDGSMILHHEEFILKQSMVNIKQDEDDGEHGYEIIKTFTVPISANPLPPQYFVKVVSDRYLHSCTQIAVPFRNLILPQRYSPPTELLDLLPTPISAINVPKNMKAAVFASGNSDKMLNPIQLQTMNALLEGDENVLVSAPPGSGLGLCAEMALMRAFIQDSNARCVYVAPFESICTRQLKRWTSTFGKGLGLNVTILTGETASDLKLLAGANICISTPERWDMISRRWKQRKHVQSIHLFIIDELHLVGSAKGAVLEIITSRMRYISSQIKEDGSAKRKCRIVALSASLANADDVGAWIGCSKEKHTLFNFHPSVRPTPLEIYIRGFNEHHFGTRMLAMSKLVYSSIIRHTNAVDVMKVKGGSNMDTTDDNEEGASKLEQTIVFVPSRRQTQLTAIDILTYANADDKPNVFQKDDDDKLAKELVSLCSKLTDKALEVTLKAGIGYMHEGLRATDRAIVDACYQMGIIRVLVVTATMCWDIPHESTLAIIMGTTRFDGAVNGYVDYPITEMMTMMGKSCVSPAGKCVVLCHSKKKEYYKKFLYTPLPVESHLDSSLGDHLCAEVVTKTVQDKQHAVDYMTWTLYYRRLTKNPNYYGIAGSSTYHINDHLSELVEEKVSELEDANCIAVENDMDLQPLNLGIIASYYYIHYTTIDFFASCVKSKSKFKTLLEILSSATEFEDVPVRHHEDRVLKTLFKHLKLPISMPNFSSARTKANILLQTHFSRTPLSTDMRADQKLILLDSLRLLSAMVDIISSNGWLKPALAVMEMSQMVVQARWKTDSPLLQVPHFDEETVNRCKAVNVTNVFDILEMEDDVREKTLQVSESQMAEIADFCNAYPDLEVEYEVQEKDDISTGDIVSVVVKIERTEEEDEDEEDDEEITYGDVYAKYYPKPKKEAWWVVIGSEKDNSLLSIKRVASLQKKTTLNLQFEAPSTEGENKFKLYLMCDSVMGCDQEHSVTLHLKKSEENSDESDSSSDEN